jgi:hypothetical protein
LKVGINGGGFAFILMLVDGPRNLKRDPVCDDGQRKKAT